MIGKPLEYPKRVCTPEWSTWSALERQMGEMRAANEAECWYWVAKVTYKERCWNWSSCCLVKRLICSSESLTGSILGRDTFFGCLWQWSVASIDDVDKGLATIVFGKKCLDWMD